MVVRKKTIRWNGERVADIFGNLGCGGSSKAYNSLNTRVLDELRYP